MFAMPLSAAEHRAPAHLAVQTSRQKIIEQEQNHHQSHSAGQDGNGHGNRQKIEHRKADEKRQQGQPAGEGQQGRQRELQIPRSGRAFRGGCHAETGMGCSRLMR